MTRSLVRALAAAVTFALWFSAPLKASAQPDDYPSRPIHFILSAGVSGGVDQMTRLFADKLSVALGQQVLVFNASGASGATGMQRFTSEKADGYTSSFGFNQLTMINPHMISNLRYDVEKDLQPVSLLAEKKFVWIVRSTFPANTIPEWIWLAKNPALTEKLSELSITSVGSSPG